MKKLLVLVLLGLVLGAGAWKAQNPEGTVADFGNQAVAVGERLKRGAMAVRDASPAMLGTEADAQASQQRALAERLRQLETSLEQIREQVPEQVRAQVQELALSQAPTVTADAAQDELAAELKTRVDGLDASLQDVQAATRDFTAGQKATHEALDASVRELQASIRDSLASDEADVVRLDTIDSRLELLVRRLDEQTVEQDLISTSDRLESLSTAVSELRDDISTQAETVNAELASVMEQAAALGLRVDTLSSAQAAIEPVASTVENPSEAAEAAGLAALTARLDQRFTALESRLATVNTDSRKIARIAEQLDDTQSRLTALQQESARDRKSMTELTATVSKLETAEESLSIDTVQDEIRDQLALVQSQFESDVSTNNTNALEKLLDNTRNQINALEQRVQELPASSSEADTAQQIQSALESQIVALERRLESMTTADPEIASTLSNVQDKVDELASRGFVTEEDLRTRNEQRNVQYKIYFDRNSAEITDAAAKVLNSFITQEKNRTTGVSIFGFTDRLGSAIYNQQLALQRATNVRSYLIQNGLDYTKIKALTGLGEDAAAAILPDEADDAQQRVVVLYAAQQ